jgi:hypothetical protein
VLELRKQRRRGPNFPPLFPHMAKPAGLLSRLRNRSDYFAPSIARCPDDAPDAKVESQDSNSSVAFSRPTTTTVRYRHCRLPLATWHRRGGARAVGDPSSFASCPYKTGADEVSMSSNPPTAAACPRPSLSLFPPHASVFLPSFGQLCSREDAFGRGG